MQQFQQHFNSHTSAKSEYGITSIGIAIPKLALPLSELAILRGFAADKYTKGLGCEFMSLCSAEENIVTLATNAAKRAVNNWQGKITDIGLLVVATETGLDMSRPLSSWIMQELNLSGNIRSYEVKHACYGGTVAIRQAIEWQLAGNSKNKSALVICADVAMYAAGHSGEPTQGAGAVAFIIGEPMIAAIDPISYAWSAPRLDFWRPVGHAYPSVNGRLSLSCYMDAVEQCFTQIAPKNQLKAYLAEYSVLCFHVPFPKMVHKAIRSLCDDCDFSRDEFEDFYNQKIFPSMAWNQSTGNIYTASLWLNVAEALTLLQPSQIFAAFSYGSGCGSELLQIQCKANQLNTEWHQQLLSDFANRELINSKQYLELRGLT